MRNKQFVINSRSDRRFVILFNIVFFTLMAWLLPIRYEVNDDVMMCMIANGHVTNNPDGHLVFINAIYGWVVALLYCWIPSVEWYTMLLCVIQVMASTGIICLVLRNNRITMFLKTLFLLFFYILWIRIIIDFQFTTTAGLLCFSGCLALLEPYKRWKLYGAFAIFVASLIRFYAAGLVGLICSPLFIIALVKDKKQLIWVSSVLLVVLLGLWADSFFYSRKEWVDYNKYNAVRSSIVDASDNSLDSMEMPEGVDYEDYQLFCSSFGDPNVMTLERLSILESRIKDKKTLNHSIEVLSQLKRYRIPVSFLCIGFLFVFVFCILERRSSSDGLVLLIPLSGFVLLLLLLVYIQITMSVKDRVFLCMLFPLTYELLLCSLLPVSEKRSSICRWVIACSMIGITMKYSVQDIKVNRADRERYQMFLSCQKALVDKYNSKDKRSFVYPANYYLDYISPFEIKDVNFRMGLGWLSSIPFDHEKIIMNHLDFLDSGVLWFGSLEEPPLGIANSIERNYGIKVEIEKVDSNDKYALYRFVSK